ncbi:hypothetical protein CN791_28810 [Salmonella enterica]|nr:hypothetical protein [Salmonella enterica]
MGKDLTLMKNSFDNEFISPFASILSMAPWIATAVIIISLYMLIRAMFIFGVIKRGRHELTGDEIKFIKMQSTMNIIISGIFLACGAWLLVTYFKL